jgi:hypothetical protein
MSWANLYLNRNKSQTRIILYSHIVILFDAVLLAQVISVVVHLCPAKKT